MSKKNPDHKLELGRINRVKGQLDGIARMIQEGQYCPEILIQTKAVRAAVQSLEAVILEKHLQHCVRSAMRSKNESEQNAKVEELLAIYRSK